MAIPDAWLKSEINIKLKAGRGIRQGNLCFVNNLTVHFSNLDLKRQWFGHFI
jgi:hypothetical protein